MAFTSFKSINEIVKAYKLYYDVQEFIPKYSETDRKPSAHLLETLDFNLTETVYDTSEASLCESIIYPLLQDVWKAYRDKLFLWSHTSIDADKELTGVPDYLVAQKFNIFNINPLYTAIDFVMKSCYEQIVSRETPSV